MSYDRGPSYVFIGSSMEGKRVADEIHDGLEDCADGMRRKLCRVQLWNEVFKPGDLVIDRLLSDCELFDFAILVTTPDDYGTSRGNEYVLPRDNLNLEIGIFLAALGRQRCIVVRPSDVNVKMPTDLSGLCYLSYDHGSYRPGRYELTQLINKIRTHLESLGHKDRKGDFITSWGYSHEQRKFQAWLDHSKLGVYGAGDYALVLGCFSGEDKALMFETEEISFSRIWKIPRDIPKEPSLNVDCSKISSKLTSGDIVWGVLFLLPDDAQLETAKNFNDIVRMGGRILDGRGNNVGKIPRSRTKKAR